MSINAQPSNGSFGPSDKLFNTSIMIALIVSALGGPLSIMYQYSGFIIISTFVLAVLSSLGMITTWHLFFTKPKDRPQWVKNGFIKRETYIPTYLGDICFVAGVMLLFLSEKYLLGIGMLSWVVSGIYAKPYMKPFTKKT